MSHKIFRLVSSLFLAIAVTVISLGTQPARAAGPWYVSTAGSDANDCLSPTTTCATVNGAIGKASSGDTVYVADDGLYTGIASEVVLIDKNITLSGGWDASFSFQGTLSRIDGQATRRGITVISGVVAAVERFSIRNGFLFNTGGGIFNNGTLTLNSSIVSSNSTDFGGGIANVGTLTLNNVIVGSNSATTFGGGILNNGTLTLNNSTVSGNSGDVGGIANSGGVLTLNNSTVFDNSSTSVGGGIVNAGGPTSTMTLNNSTVSGNSAIDSGGGIANFSGTGTVTLNYSTITNNTSDSDNDGSGEGGGIINGNSNGSVTLLSSIIAGNKWGPSGVSAVTADCFSFGMMISQGYNLTGSGTGCDPLGGTGDVTVTPANVFTDVLGPLGDNGGSIPLATHALIDSLSNPALNAIASGTNSCGSTPFDLDQRGVARPQDAACDIGAFELEGGVIPGPTNDNFGSATSIGALPFSATVDNTEATVEPGEPAFCSPSFRSVWYTFTPTENMALRVTLTGQSAGYVDIFLASGPGIADLTSLGCGRSPNIQMDAGHTYYLRVDSIGQPGVFQLNLEQISPPGNDRFTNAEAITSLPFSATVDNTNATDEPNEPQGPCSFHLLGTVWYSFTPAEDLALRVNSPVGGVVNLFLASGPALSDLTFLTCISSGGSQNFALEAGLTYYLQVDSFARASALQFSLEQITAPSNDNFADAAPINSFPFSASVDNTNATSEFGEPHTCSAFAFRSVWYSFTPTENTAFRVNLSGTFSGYVDIFLASGPGISDLTSLTCGSSTSFQADAGNTYYLRVDSRVQPGVFQLNLEQIFPPANDRFANAEAINTLPFSATVNNTDATVEPGEIAGCGSRFQSVWYSFTPTQNMALRVDMAGSQVGGTVEVSLASGLALSDLHFLTCTSTGNSTTFYVDAGETYYLRVDSFGLPGVLQFNLQQVTPPANDYFADAEVIGSLPFSATVDNTDATSEAGEPFGCLSPFRSLWYAFTPAEDMAVRVTGPNNGAVNVYRASGPALSDLISLGCAPSGTSRNIQLQAGSNYYLRVDSFGQPSSLQFSVEQITPPANDNFADAEPIGSLPFSSSVDNTNATTETGETGFCSAPSRSVWYSFTPTEDMALQVDILDGISSSAVHVFLAPGPSLADLIFLTCTFSGTPTNFQVEAGQLYYLRVDSFGQPGVLQVNLQQIAAPANDDSVNAETINALPFTATIDNTEATTEAGEPTSCGNAFSFRTAWYSFTPTNDTSFRVDMAGSQVGGLVSVFRASGPAFSDLTSVACASSGLSTNLQAEAGQTYYLRVDSSFGQPGVLQLNLEQIVPPGNDNFADTEVTNTLPFSTSVDNTNATTEPGEPIGCSFPFRTVWYSFTPAQNMSIRISGPSQGVVNVFLASSPTFADLTSLACVYGGNPSNMQLEAGQVYYFRLDSSFGQSGILQFSLEQIFPPANDSFATPEAIGPLPRTVTVDNADATTEPGEPFGCALNRSLWYSFTPAENMAVRVSLAGSAITGNVSVFLVTGPSISDLSLLTCAGSSPTTFQAEAGNTYYLRLDSFGQAGVLQLNVARLNPPANDNLGSAVSIRSVPFTASVDITDATAEPNEPQFCYFMPSTVWYSFSPLETMALRADTLGSPINGNVNVYRSIGTGFANLQFLTCSGPSSSPMFTAEAGQTYYLQVGSASGVSGTVKVNLVQTIPPANDNLASAVAVTSLPFSATVDITDATNEPDEPQNCNFMPNTVWYSFSPAEAIKVRADAQGGAINGNVNIYHATGNGFPDLQFIGCSGFGAATAFLAEAGETYYFQAGGDGQPGAIQINLTEMASISGRVTDAVTGTPLPGDVPPFALVTLQKACGDGCFEFVNSQFADSAGRFLFDSYYQGAPLSNGSYRIEVSANLYVTTGFGPFEFTGVNLDLGDLPLSPPAAIRGRAVDANTASAVSGASVTLLRCDDSGCFEFVNSQTTDGNGQFQFNSYYYGVPFPAGTYELEFSSAVYETRRVQVTITDGENRDLGDVALTPLPLIGSISGKLVDKVTGKAVSQVFTPSLALYRCTNGDCFEFVNSLVPDSLGRFRFDVDYSGNPIPVGTFQVRAYADQYQEYQGTPFSVGMAEHKDVRNIRLTSFPIRFSEMRACSEIPAAGGDCVYRVKITNGLPTKLKGSAWSLVSSSLPDSYLGHTDFQARDKLELELDPGKSRTMYFRFQVPANRSSYGSFVCTRVFVGKSNSKSNNALFNTIGFRDLFCVIRNATGFTIASEAEMTSLQDASTTAATGTDSEPNSSCPAAQDLSGQSYPFVLSGELDSSQNPDVDFFRFTGTPGLLATVDLEGQATGKGTLGDPYLGFFDSNCNPIAIDDDGGESVNSRLEITIPDDGVFVLAATLCCDGGFAGGGSGSYQLSVTPVQVIGSISGLVTDAISGKPLRGDVLPYANVSLLHCTQFGCSGVNNQAAGPDGSFNFTSDYNGAPLRVGNYLVAVSADQYEPYQADVQNIGEGEHRDLGNIPLTSYPVRFSDFQGCDIPSKGDLCEFSVKLTNGLSKRFAGKAWTIIYGSGTGSFVNFTHFQTNTALDVSLDPGKSRTLRFRFRVREAVADGAVICGVVFVGQKPNAQFSTLGRADLFCVVKGANGFTLMSEQDMHTQLQQMQIPEAAPTTAPSLPDK